MTTKTSQVEFKIDTDGQALMRVKGSGVVALYYAHKPQMTGRGTHTYYDASGRAYNTGTTVFLSGERKVTAWPVTTVRYHKESYRMRGTKTRPSDSVYAFERYISGRHYEISRVIDGVTDATTITLFAAGTTTVLKRFVYPKENA